MDMIKGCLSAYDLDVTGTHEEVHARLGTHLVAVKLGMKPLRANGKRPYTPRRGDRKAKEHKKNDKKSRPSHAEWIKFLREEKEKVKSELGLTDRVAIMKEVGRRWKVLKQSGSSAADSSLLLLT